MKKMILCAVLLGMSASLFALRPGDVAKELVGVRWVSGIPFNILSPKELRDDDPKFRAVVFLQVRAQTTDDTLTLLNYLRRTFARQVRFAVVTPDSEADVKELLERRKDFELSFGVDGRREITPTYLGNLRFLPLAFIVDQRGEIIWAGEAVDLGETLHRCLDGSFNKSIQRKIAPLFEELQTLLTGDNESRMRRTVNSIFELEPGHPSALRIRCFVLESTGREKEALDLIRSQITRIPTRARLYTEALNLIGRNPSLENETGAVITSYLKSVPSDADMDNQIAWLLLTRREDSPEALRNAVKLSTRAASNLPANASDALRGANLNTQALLACRLGKIEQAIRLQEEAVKAFKKAALGGAESDANRKLNYYRTVLELSKSNN